MATKKNPMEKYWFGKQAPEHAAGWYEFYRSVSKEGVLDKKTKELIAVAAGVLCRCEHCVHAHANDALRAGASKREIAEAIMVANQTASGSHLFWTDLYEDLLGEADEE